MPVFSFTRERIDATAARARLADPAAGGYAAFEGWVRNHNEGRSVTRLEYEAFEPLAVKEGERIVAEAKARFGIEHAACVHRIGDLPIGEMAVWVGVSARHRHEAFVACRYIIDEVKHRVPIWKKEHYDDGDSGWVNCERCSQPLESPVQHPENAHTHHSHGPRIHIAGSPGLGLVADYSRQIALKEVGVAGQTKLRASRVLVVGCGGLAVPVIGYLSGAGIGRLGLIDSDRLEPSNLHRQTLYSLADVGQLKAELAAVRSRALNPDVDVQSYAVRLDADNAMRLVSEYDLVLDCTDNFATKFLLNDVCVQLGKPAVFASVYQYEGQLQVVRPREVDSRSHTGTTGGACLRCIWPEATRDGIVGNCAEAGVLGPVPGVLGGLQALEALKLLLDLPGQLTDEILILDLLTLSISRVRARKAASCPDHAGQSLHGRTPDRDIEMSFDTLDQAVEAGFEILDVREPAETVEAPAPHSGVRQIPMAQLLYGGTDALAGARRPVLLLCASGRRSLAAAQELRARGRADVYSLKGGLRAISTRMLT